MSDVFDTQFEGNVELEDNRVNLGEDINVSEKDPALKKILIGAGWDLNAFNADAVDLDLSLFLLDKDMQTRKDSDFVFYNQGENLENGVRHHGDNRTGAGDGDDENISLDLTAVSFEVMHIALVISIYKGFEKEQNLDMVRNGYVRLVNADNDVELLRFELDQHFKDKNDIGVITGILNREGPKWHYKADLDFAPRGLSEIAQRYGIIIGQE